MMEIMEVLTVVGVTLAFVAALAAIVTWIVSRSEGRINAKVAESEGRINAKVAEAQKANEKAHEGITTNIKDGFKAVNQRLDDGIKVVVGVKDDITELNRSVGRLEGARPSESGQD